jgi:putative DNA primase/helicase
MAALIEEKFGCEAVVTPDENYHRFEDPEKGRGNRNIWALLREDETFGVCGNWATGEKYYYFGDGWTGDFEAHGPEADARLDEVYRDHEAERRARHDAVAVEAQDLLSKASPPRLDHIYLAKKRVAAANARQYGERLLIPLQNVQGEVRNLQQIYANGDKRFLKGGEVKGNFSLLGADKLPMTGTLLLCEGWATAVTLNATRGVPVAAAMNAGNLADVASRLRNALHETVTIVIAADDDRHTAGNPGIAMALAAGELIGAEVITPRFPCDNCQCTDFNDAHACPHWARNAAAPTDVDVHQPDPLDDTLLPVLPMTPEMLPERFVGFVTTTAEQMQTPPDYLAAAVMAVAAGVVGAKAEIRPKQHDPWLVTPTLWAALVGAPSSMKSPCLKAATRPVLAIESDLRDAYASEMQLYELERELAEEKQEEAKLEAKALLPKDREKARDILEAAQGELSEPTQRRIVVNDATVEKVGEIMKDNPTGLLLVRDELSGFVAKQSREDTQTERAFFLECFDGQNPYTYDRIGRGTIHIERCVLAIVGGIQPSRLAPLVKGAVDGTADDGFLQRFQLAVWPDLKKGWKYTDTAPDREAYAQYEAAIRALHAIGPGTADSGPLTLQFTTDAQDVFKAWMEDVYQRARQGDVHPVTQAYLIKLPKTVATLALLFELIDGGREAVGLAAIERAVKWARYLESHAQRLFSVGGTPKLSAAKTIVARRDKLDDIFTVRDIQRRSWTGLTENAAIETALDILVDHRFLERVEIRKSTSGGRPPRRSRWLIPVGWKHPKSTN